MICFRKIVDDTVDVGLDVFRTLNVYMMVCGNMQRIGYTKVVPENLVQRLMFVDPDDLSDRYNGNPVV